MWPRISEIVLGLGLMAAAASLEGPAWGGIAVGALAAVVIAASAACFARRFRRAHLITLAASLGLCALPFLRAYPAPPLLQGALIGGLVIAMFAIIPVGATRPPEEWTRFESAMDGQQPFGETRRKT